MVNEQDFTLAVIKKKKKCFGTGEKWGVYNIVMPLNCSVENGSFHVMEISLQLKQTKRSD